MYKRFTVAQTVHFLLLTAVAGVSVQTLPAQSNEKATAIQLEGQVSVVRHGFPVALFQKGTPGVDVGLSTVNAREEIETGPDGHAIFQIRDGSTFEVFANSRVLYQPEWTFEDMLEVILGKIRATIEHRNGPNHKKIQTPTAVISVRGTVFDVAVEDADGTTYVEVFDGQVQVHHRLQPGQDKVLNPPDAIRIFPNQPLAQNQKGNPGAGAMLARVVRNAMGDLVLNNPGGVIGGTGSGGAQGDTGKTKKNPPTSAPPPAPANTPPPLPGGK